MTKPIFYVDFNEMVERDLVLLSRFDNAVDRYGNEVLLFSGMEVDIYSDDVDEQGNADDLIASGRVEINTKRDEWSSHVKWCCRIDNRGVRHRSE
jgi:hypothetical protein